MRPGAIGNNYFILLIIELNYLILFRKRLIRAKILIFASINKYKLVLTDLRRANINRLISVVNI